MAADLLTASVDEFSVDKLKKPLRFIDADNRVVAIEHKLGPAKAADWVMDLGPEGGNR